MERFIHLFISWSVQIDLTPRGKWWAKATQCLHAQARGRCTPLLIATHLKILEPETWWGNIGERLNCKFPQYQYQSQSHLPLVKGQLSASLTPRACPWTWSLRVSKLFLIKHWSHGVTHNPTPSAEVAHMTQPPPTLPVPQSRFRVTRHGIHSMWLRQKDAAWPAWPAWPTPTASPWLSRASGFSGFSGTYSSGDGWVSRKLSLRC